MIDCNPHATPLPIRLTFSKSQCPTNDAERLYMKDKPYKEVLSSIMWGQITTRPDLSHSVTQYSVYQVDPGPTHWDVMLHTLGYIKRTLDYSITYTKSDNDDLQPTGYVNTDYSGDTDT